MNFPPYLGTVVAAVLSVVTAVGVAAQVVFGTDRQQIPGLVMQGAMSMMWGGMALRFWNKAQVARLTRQHSDDEPTLKSGSSR